jgi:hypothetical protein
MSTPQVEHLFMCGAGKPGLEFRKHLPGVNIQVLIIIVPMIKDLADVSQGA